MKVNVKIEHGRLFEDIGVGEVFYSEADPRMFLLRTDTDTWVAVDIETGELYHAENFDLTNPQYHIVNAEVIIS